MRLLIDSMILIMVVVIVAAAVLYQRAGRDTQANLLTVQQSLVDFDEQLTYHSVLWQSRNEQAGDYPPQVMPEWFKDGVPSNPLLAGQYPWIDIAPPEDYSQHPPDPIVEASGQAGFWYNPNLGIVRARVPRQVTEQKTLELYNQANHVYLSKLPTDPDPDRIPLVFNPDPVTSGQQASPVRRAIGTIETFEPQEPDEPVAETEPQSEVLWYEKRVVPETSAEPDPTPVQEDVVVEAPARQSLIGE